MALTTEIMARRASNANHFDVYTPIHSKYVPNPEELSTILKDHFGAGEYRVEVCLHLMCCSPYPLRY
ncbi:hypothetical protein F4774DRAFT_379815 [Daldinia eschscholtzii]|nr:hypothetical protein F4774DRAFT_379815 [Daldinia eschscholtzii]